MPQQRLIVKRSKLAHLTIPLHRSHLTLLLLISTLRVSVLFPHHLSYLIIHCVAHICIYIYIVTPNNIISIITQPSPQKRKLQMTPESGICALVQFKRVLFLFFLNSSSSRQRPDPNVLPMPPIINRSLRLLLSSHLGFHPRE